MKNTLVIILGVENHVGREVLKSISSSPNNLDIVSLHSGKEVFAVFSNDRQQLNYSQNLELRNSGGDVRFAYASGGTVQFSDYQDARLLMIAPRMDERQSHDWSSLPYHFIEHQKALVGMVSLATHFAEACVHAGIKGRIVAVSSPAEQNGIRKVLCSPSQAILDGLVDVLVDSFGDKGVTTSLLRTGVPESILDWEFSQSDLGGSKSGNQNPDGWLGRISGYVVQYLVTGEHPHDSQVIDI